MAQQNPTISTNNDKVVVTIQPLPFGGGARLAAGRGGGIFVPQGFPPQIMPPQAFPPGTVPLLGPGMMGPGGPFPYPPGSTVLPSPGERKDSQDLATKEGEEEGGKTEGVEGGPAEGEEGEGKRDEVPYLDSTKVLEVPPEYEVSRPPPQVMTALGPMPLPDEIREKIPEKFVAKPIIEERDIYVAKKEVQERTIEIPHVQYEHRFNEVPKAFTVDRLVPNVKEVVKEIPREVYKAVIEEKVIEVPQGVKYVEVPVEVPCMYPPKIVPKPVTQLVERVVETIKPVVKEEIVEVPQTVVKQIPKIKKVEVPYYVPRYIEKTIEVPYKPSPTGELPVTYTGGMPDMPIGQLAGMPSRFHSHYFGGPSPFTLGPMPLAQINEIKLPYEAKIEVKVTQPDFAQGFFNAPPGGGRFGVGGGNMPPQFRGMGGPPPTMPGFPMGGPGMPGGMVGGPGGGMPMSLSDAQGPGMGAPQPGEAGAGGPPGRAYGNVKLPEGYKWGAPPNAPPPMGTALERCGSSCLQYPSGKPQLPPMMVTCPPEVGKVSFASYLHDPDILTRSGVLPYEGFKTTGNAQMLFPPLPAHPHVPMAPPPAQPGTPDVHTLDAVAVNAASYAEAQNPFLQKLKTGLYNQKEQQEQQRNIPEGATCVLFNSSCMDGATCCPRTTEEQHHRGGEDDGVGDIIIGEGGEIRLRGVSGEPQ